jgi:hypothetical protein
MAEHGQSQPATTRLDSIRHDLAALCRRSRGRALGWPRDWRPGTTVDPRDPDNQVFTEVGAWEFVAELLEGGHAIQEIELDNPRGKTGYVMLASGGAQRPEIYIKLQLGSGTVIGRSFHYSEGPRQ